MDSNLDLDTVEKSRDLAVGQIQFARQYSLELLNNTPKELWFQIPEGAPTHIAWQVGHLSYSEYGLLLFRQRGREPEDLELIPSRFRKQFGRGTTPDPDASRQPTPDELLERLEAVHHEAMADLKTCPLERLVEPIDMPYAVYPNKLGAVLFCPLHEHIHAGQIGLIRRLLDLDPVR